MIAQLIYVYDGIAVWLDGMAIYDGGKPCGYRKNKFHFHNGLEAKLVCFFHSHIHLFRYRTLARFICVCMCLMIVIIDILS